MQMEPQISFKGFEPSHMLRQRVLDRIDRLEQFHDRITSCRVVIEAPHHHGRLGKLYHVRVDITVPQGEIVINREPELNHAHEDADVAVRDAFDAAQRRLEDHVRKLGGVRVKEHPIKTHGKVVRVFAEEGYGFILTEDGREFFFEQDSVTGDDWTILDVDSKVRFREMSGDAGPYAVAVSVIKGGESAE
ncbi:MAG: HPF/RaiA family ribosome-associated protein [Hyphomicrobiales bacterium]|nr:HPF/RaiA family ribosome-associated protein [Hyphomicrobiales bacterium]